MCDPQVRFCERPGGESPRAYSTERPATGMGSPKRDANREDTQVDNLCYEKPRAK
jgi:hypothetical protein